MSHLEFERHFEYSMAKLMVTGCGRELGTGMPAVESDQASTQHRQQLDNHQKRSSIHRIACFPHTSLLQCRRYCTDPVLMGGCSTNWCSCRNDLQNNELMHLLAK